MISMSSPSYCDIAERYWMTRSRPRNGSWILWPPLLSSWLCGGSSLFCRLLFLIPSRYSFRPWPLTFTLNSLRWSLVWFCICILYEPCATCAGVPPPATSLLRRSCVRDYFSFFRVWQECHAQHIISISKTYRSTMSVIRRNSSSRQSSFPPRIAMRLHHQSWVIAAVALLVIVLTSAHSITSNVHDDNARQLLSSSPPRRLATPSTANFPTITITTPASDPYAFTGMPETLKAGTYKFKYINNSDVPHNFKIRGAGGFRATPICAECTEVVTVTLKRSVNGVLAPNREYVCEPHASFMKGTVKITAAKWGRLENDDRMDGVFRSSHKTPVLSLSLIMKIERCEIQDWLRGLEYQLFRMLVDLLRPSYLQSNSVVWGSSWWYNLSAIVQMHTFVMMCHDCRNYC